MTHQPLVSHVYILVVVFERLFTFTRSIYLALEVDVNYNCKEVVVCAPPARLNMFENRNEMAFVQ